MPTPMKNIAYSIVLAAIMVVGALAGCIGDNPPTNDEDVPSPEQGGQENQTQNQSVDNGTNPDTGNQTSGNNSDGNTTVDNGTGDNGTTNVPLDADGDGSTDDIDCDDVNPEIHPNATDVWNGIDDDCDGVIDPFLQRQGNASFQMQWESIGWVIDDMPNMMGHTLYWLGNEYFAYRFLASPDQVFETSNASTIHNFSNSTNVDSTLANLNLSASNISISMTEMNLGDDIEDIDWEFDDITYIETRYYSGGEFIFSIDGQEFMRVEVGFTEYLNYGEHYDANITEPSVKIYGHSSYGAINITADQVTQPNLWRLAESFAVDYNGQIQFGFVSQDAIIKEHYNEQHSSAITLNVVSNITDLLICQSEGESCPNWIAAEFNQLISRVISSED